MCRCCPFTKIYFTQALSTDYSRLQSAMHKRQITTTFKFLLYARLTAKTSTFNSINPIISIIDSYKILLHFIFISVISAAYKRS